MTLTVSRPLSSDQEDRRHERSCCEQEDDTEEKSNGPEPHVFAPPSKDLSVLCRQLALSHHWKRSVRDLNFLASFGQAVLFLVPFAGTSFPHALTQTLWIINTAWTCLQICYWGLIDQIGLEWNWTLVCHLSLTKVETWVSVAAVYQTIHIIQDPTLTDTRNLQYGLITLQVLAILLTFTERSQNDLAESDRLLNSSHPNRMLDCKDTMVKESDLWREAESYAIRDVAVYYNFEIPNGQFNECTKQ